MYVRGCGFRWKNWGCHGLLRKNSVPLEPAPKRDDRHLVVLCLVLASPLVHSYAIVHCTSSSYVGWRTGLLQLLTLQLIDDNFPARILHSTCGHLVCTFPPTTSCTYVVLLQPTGQDHRQIAAPPLRPVETEFLLEAMPGQIVCRIPLVWWGNSGGDVLHKHPISLFFFDQGTKDAMLRAATAWEAWMVTK